MLKNTKTIIKWFTFQDVYFVKDSVNKCPKGKLYCKYFNTMRCMKQNGLISTTRKDSSSIPKKKLTRTMDNLQTTLGNIIGTAVCNYLKSD